MKKAIIIFSLLLAIPSCEYDTEKKPKPPATNEPAPPPPTPPPSTNPPSPPGGGIVEKQQYLVFHNLKRCWHAVGDITWDDNLASTAAAHAKLCTLKKDPLLKDYGENIAFGENLDQIKAQDDWYMQFLYFPYGQKDGSVSTQEFSNVVLLE